jgi:hypothetical protein
VTDLSKAAIVGHSLVAWIELAIRQGFFIAQDDV